ncbi:hypothetical protein Slala03_28030 [Streptomyces lavendulae subsp. lavendulae]|nr:hypothetical protein Slala03_28030 [Streptomyces lavendulae subsp. lavendulae]
MRLSDIPTLWLMNGARIHELRGYEVGPVRAELRALTVEDNREGMLEGTPYLHRRMSLLRIGTAMTADPHLYVHDLDVLRADAESRLDEWLPRETVRARLKSWWLPEGITDPGHTELSVMWFQTAAEDPFARLAAILRPLEWTSLARFVPFED